MKKHRAPLVAALVSACLFVPSAAAPAGVTTTPRAAGRDTTGSSLETAAAKAGNTGRAVAMSKIGLWFALAATQHAIILDNNEAAAV